MSREVPLNILLLMTSSHAGVGGMEKHTQELANGLAQRGHRITLMAAPQHQQLVTQSVKRKPLNPRQSRRNPLQLIRVTKFIREQDFDIVHAQGTKAASLIRLVAPFLGKSHLIATIHGFKSRYPSAGTFSRVIAVSETLSRQISGNNVTVVYNGLSPELLPPLPADILAKELHRPVWLAVGRLVDAKGFDFLIEAFKTANGCLYIAGDGLDRPALQKQIDDYQLNDHVTLLGHREDIPELMAACDGVVISSRREGFSYVFAEALFADKPVIATDVPIANEFLPLHHIFKGTGPEDLAHMLNTDLGKVFGEQEAARDRARQQLTMNAMVKNTLGVYQQALES